LTATHQHALNASDRHVVFGHEMLDIAYAEKALVLPHSYMIGSHRALWEEARAASAASSAASSSSAHSFSEPSSAAGGAASKISANDPQSIAFRSVTAIGTDGDEAAGLAVDAAVLHANETLLRRTRAEYGLADFPALDDDEASGDANDSSRAESHSSVGSEINQHTGESTSAAHVSTRRPRLLLALHQVHKWWTALHLWLRVLSRDADAVLCLPLPFLDAQWGVPLSSSSPPPPPPPPPHDSSSSGPASESELGRHSSEQTDQSRTQHRRREARRSARLPHHALRLDDVVFDMEQHRADHNDEQADDSGDSCDRDSDDLDGEKYAHAEQNLGGGDKNLGCADAAAQLRRSRERSAVMRALAAAVVAANVSAARVWFLPRLRSRAAHLRRMACFDLFLDTAVVTGASCFCIKLFVSSVCICARMIFALLGLFQS
jgi:hypothetical protein